MFKLLIFGGTTEGRMLAEFCSQNRINADISVATEYGSSLLTENEYLNVFAGRLDIGKMTELIYSGGYNMVIDATHPYAEEVTNNVKTVCINCKIPYYRLLRDYDDTAETYGDIAENTEELISMLNKNKLVILSTLGSKSLKRMTEINNYRERVWARVLPSDGIIEYCRELGYDERKIICEKGSFSTEQNISHIISSNAEVLVTKDSGAAGGYPEKISAARKCGINMITLARPKEIGYDLYETEEIILHQREKSMK